MPGRLHSLAVTRPGPSTAAQRSTHYALFQRVEAPWHLALAQKATRRETKDRIMPGFGGDLGEGDAGTQRRGWNRAGRNLQGMTGTWVQARGSKGGGGELVWKRRQTQARGAGRRDERHSLAGGG